MASEFWPRGGGGGRGGEWGRGGGGGEWWRGAGAGDVGVDCGDSVRLGREGTEGVGVRGGRILANSATGLRGLNSGEFRYGDEKRSWRGKLLGLYAEVFFPGFEDVIGFF